MNIEKVEREILRALDINAKVDWLTVDPNKEFKDLKKFVRQLFKDYREGKVWKNIHLDHQKYYTQIWKQL